ncbi:hypothetical protein P154DRAFT_13775 [Amniculicola lignicola CBS 123094]|uniref:HAD-like protein n=1 Tax=Amniculicola lignicola CBS 123094 TaxID=1392246 RepID=A0A6A5X4W1_9PLEO|nr:hypothetical protein P154DRAFT_13775 [Amniculicola lignicola CBS 123094]
MVRRVFHFRDPIQVLDICKYVGWSDMQSLIDCYENMYRMLEHSPAPALSSLVHERLIADPGTEVKRICFQWERFAALLSHFGLPTGEELPAHLLQLYESKLTASLELKGGVMGLPSIIGKLGGEKLWSQLKALRMHRIALSKLIGPALYIDFLATTNHFRVPMTDRLFLKALKHLGISPGDIAYVGDSEQRDMKPAIMEGTLTIHLDEAKHISLASFPPRINTLRKSYYMVADDRIE